MINLKAIRFTQLPKYFLNDRLITSTRKFSEDIVEDEKKGYRKRKRESDPTKDRTKPIPVETSIKYMNSNAYRETYGDELVWKLYRPSHKFQKPRILTRATCIWEGYLQVGNPCPICRDEYLVLDYRNLKLIKQFISPHTDEVIDAYFTQICQRRHFELLVAVEKARDIGLLGFYVPKRVYNLEEYYRQNISI